MRSVAVLALLLLYVAGAQALAELSSAPAALLAVCFFVGLASVVQGQLGPASIIAGAVAALAQAALSGVSGPLAGALALALTFAPRSRHILGGRWAVAVHLALAAAGGALSAWITGLFEPTLAGASVWAVALVVGTLLCASPFLLRTDDRLAAELEALAREVSGTARWRLERAAALRRRMLDNDLSIPRAERRRIVGAFAALVGLGRTRALARSADADALDEVIGEHLSALERSFQVLVARAVAVASTRTAAAEELKQDNLSIEAEAEAFAVTSPRGPA